MQRAATLLRQVSEVERERERSDTLEMDFSEEIFRLLSVGIVNILRGLDHLVLGSYLLQEKLWQSEQILSKLE